MKTWVRDPHSGGVKISDALKREAAREPRASCSRTAFALDLDHGARLHAVRICEQASREQVPRGSSRNPRDSQCLQYRLRLDL
jgi:hypothetical protein